MSLSLQASGSQTGSSGDETCWLEKFGLLFIWAGDSGAVSKGLQETLMLRPASNQHEGLQWGPVKSIRSSVLVWKQLKGGFLKTPVGHLSTFVTHCFAIRHIACIPTAAGSFYHSYIWKVSIIFRQRWHLRLMYVQVFSDGFVCNWLFGDDEVTAEVQSWLSQMGNQ